MKRKIFLIVFFYCVIAVQGLAFGQLTEYNDHDSENSSFFIPAWIKNTAGWWAKGDITENEFLRAIQYLIDSNVIKIASSKTQNLPDVTTTYTLPANRQVGS